MSRVRTIGPALQLVRDAVGSSALQSGMGAMALVALNGLLAACLPLALKHMVDAVAGMPHQRGSSLNAMLLPGTIYLLMLVGGRVASDLRPLLAGRVEQHVLTTIRQRFMSHVLHLPLAYLVNRRKGELTHAVDLATAGAQAVISQLTNGIVPVVIELALMIAILVGLDQVELVVTFVATCTLYWVIYAISVLRQRPAVQALTAASLVAHSKLSDGIAHVETLRCFGAEPQAEQGLASASSQLTSRWMRFHGLSVQAGLTVTVVFALAQGACLAIAANAVAEGRMTPGGFVLVGVYTLQIVRPLESLGAAVRDIARASGFIRPLLDILSEPTQVSPQLPGSSPVPARAPSIRLEGLTFGYDPHHPVIRGLNLEIAAGCRTAVVGRSGSGKSSLARLLARLYAPQAGRLLIDGRSLDSLNDAELRSLIGLVPQDAGLLQASVRDNIALGLPDATLHQIEEAARRSQIHELIVSLANGYDTQIGENGQTLSGGERQRLAIARAVLRRPSVYVLDEPTSMLDSKTEADVLRELRAVTAGCTTLIIAHRLSTVMDADEIVVLEHGQVHERGRHADLLAKDGLYAQLWRQQMADVP